jgi:hypothetical protein
VATKVRTGFKSEMERLRHLAVVFAVELRLKIVPELYMREMSAKQFHAEFGGGSLSRVSQNFRRLDDTIWIREVRSEGPGGERRGLTEKFYRATDLPYFDNETWAMLPYSLRVALSWNAFKQIAQRLIEALEAKTFQTRSDSHLTVMRLSFDETGWRRVGEAMGAEFASQFEEQEDSRRRVERSGEESIRASSFLIAFELPSLKSEPPSNDLVERPEPLIPLPLRLAKVFTDEMCLLIIDEANRGEVSAPEFHAKYGAELNVTVESVQRRFRKLERIALLEEVDSKTGGRRRGARERFFRATGPAFLEDESWPSPDVPESVKRTDDWASFERLSKDAREAMIAGTFDARADRWLAWSILSLDQQGWTNVAASTKAHLDFALKEAKRSEARVARSGETPIIATIVVGAFESPPNSVKEP